MHLRKSTMPRFSSIRSAKPGPLAKFLSRLVTTRGLLVACFTVLVIKHILGRGTQADYVGSEFTTKEWSQSQIIEYMRKNPDRAFFSRLFRYGGFRVGMEVGVADGRFSEHFLVDNAKLPFWTWHMVEPFPNPQLKQLFHIDHNGVANFSKGLWAGDGIGRNAKLVFHQHLSSDAVFRASIQDNTMDFVYLDGAHNYQNVKDELPFFFKKVRGGGVLAGHDYCNHGEKGLLGCVGCASVPLCVKYTEYGISHGKTDTVAANQNGVVRAVQEFLRDNHPSVELHHTDETFTVESLSAAGLDYNLIITNTRNPSWFLIKPYE